MLVYHVKEFTKKLKSHEAILSKFDVDLIKEFTDRVSNYAKRVAQTKDESHLVALSEDDPDLLELDEQEIGWLKDVFLRRWQEVFDKPKQDYTFYSGGVNAFWIAFAKDLAEQLKTHYLQILISPQFLQNISDSKTFYRLHHMSDSTQIYIDEKNQSWHDTNGLYSYTKNYSLFGVTDGLKPLINQTTRGITITELNRLRNKQTDNTIEIKKKSYNSIWDYFQEEIFPHWSINRTFPRQMLPYLFNIVESYYKENKRNLPRMIEELMSALMVLSLEEINNFYGTNIRVLNKSVFLVDFLLNCKNDNEPQLAQEMMSLGEWLAVKDHSRIVDCPQLMPTYERLKVGPYFDWNRLNSQLRLLTKTTASPDIEKLIAELNSSKEIRTTHLNDLKKIYASHWRDVKDKAGDYFRSPVDDNNPWVKLGQLLAGAKLIKGNYYQLLIPTLQQENEKATKAPLTDNPLEQYILNEDGTELIHLPSSASWAAANNVFFNMNNMCNLTKIEQQRLSYAPEAYFTLFKTIEKQKIALPLSNMLFVRIKELIDTSLFVEGLKDQDKGYDKDDEIPPDDNQNNISLDSKQNAQKSYKVHAVNAYKAFAKFYKKLPKDEKKVFDSQSVFYNFAVKNAKQILDEAIEGKECLSICSQLFVKLLIDYRPNEEFKPQIEASGWINDMRRLSQRRVMAENHHIRQEEATRRLKILMVSLLTHKFEVMQVKPHQITLWDCSNTVTSTGYAIFIIIENLIEQGDLRDAPFIYQYIQENCIESALLAPKSSRSDDTTIWLTKIKNQALFTEIPGFNSQHIYLQMDALKNQYLAKMALLQRELNNDSLTDKSELLKQYNSVVDKINGFMNVMINIWQQSPEKSFKKSIRINIGFIKFLLKFDVTAKQELLEKLKKEPEPRLTKEQFMVHVQKHLIEYFSTIVTKEKKSSIFSLFIAAPNQQTVNKEQFGTTLQKQLDEKLKTRDCSEQPLMKNLLDCLAEVLSTIPAAAKLAESSLKQLTNSISDPEYIYPSVMPRGF